jgi:hypothetical protein
MGRRVVRRKGRKEEERRGSEGVYVSFWREPESDDWARKYAWS